MTVSSVTNVMRRQRVIHYGLLIVRMVSKGRLMKRYNEVNMVSASRRVLGE